MEVLANISPGSRLIFTPHTQPIWTLADSDRAFMVRPVLADMLAASDLVLLDTPGEISHMPEGALDAARALQVPLGVDTDRFRPDDGAAADTRRAFWRWPIFASIANGLTFFCALWN